MTEHHLELFADYCQFYLQDISSATDLSDAWTDESVQRMLAVAPGVVGVGTARNETVPVTVITLTSAPPLDLSDWDHVTECSLAVPTGEVVIAGSTDYLPTAKRVSVSPGVYRVRVSYGGLSTISADGFDGDDRYRVQLWPQAACPIAVLKDRAAG